MRIISVCCVLVATLTPTYARNFLPRSGPEGSCGASCGPGHPCLKIERPEFDEAGNCECIPEPDCGATMDQKEKVLRDLQKK